MITVEEQAFANNDYIKSMNITSVATISKYFCKSCKSLTTLIMSSDVLEMDYQSFYNCPSLTSITIGESVVQIKQAAFAGSLSLTKLVIPASVRSIGAGALAGCPALHSLVFETTDVEIETGLLASCDALTTDKVYFPNALQNLYFASGVEMDTQTQELLRVTCTGSTCSCETGSGNTVLAPYASDYFTCSECVKGTHSIYSPQVVSRCVACAPGTYQPFAGQTLCEPCPPGASCDSNGSVAYSPCPIGTYQDAKASTSCALCPVGRYQGDTGTAVCSACAAGTSNPFSGSVDALDCFPCMPGRYGGVPGLGQCSPCRENTYAATTMATACSKCAEGTTTTNVTSDGTGATRCAPKPCGAGQAPAAHTSLCVSCAPGRYSSSGAACELCEKGSYSASTGSVSCAKCPVGRYGNAAGGTDVANGCLPCRKGTFMNMLAASACFECPPGSSCPDDGMQFKIACPPGQYSDVRSQLACKRCPSGTYQHMPGSAMCVLCRAGKHSALSGATSASACTDCPAGYAAGQNGTAACVQCSLGQFQPQAGQAMCHVCTVYYNDDTLTSNADRTACIVNDKLLAMSVVEVLFWRGAALYGAFIIAGAFVAMSAVMERRRLMHADSLGHVGYADAAINSFLCGFSFGSELFLVAGVMADAPGIAATMILFRLLHVAGGVVMLGATFGSPETALMVEAVLAKAPLLNDDMDHVFARAHSSYVGSLMLLTMCDVTMLQFLPWKRSTFYTESEGYPDLSVMKFAVGIKTVQALASVLCQMSYLALETKVHDPTTSPEAQALFALNIVFSVSAVSFGLVMLVIKNNLLRSVQKQHEVSVQKRCFEESGDGVQMSELHSGHDEVNAGMTMLDERVSEGGGMVNPMHTEEVQGMRRRVVALTSELDELLRKERELLLDRNSE